MNRRSRRLLIGLIVSLGLAVVCVGAFWVGMLVGQVRGGPAPVFGEPSPPKTVIPKPWPFDLPFGRPPQHPRAHGAIGVIDRIEGDTLILTGRWGNRVQVQVTDRTLIRRGKARIELADLKVGDPVAVIGKPSPDGGIEAQVIWVLSRGRESSDWRRWGIRQSGNQASVLPDSLVS